MNISEVLRRELEEEVKRCRLEVLKVRLEKIGSILV